MIRLILFFLFIIFLIFVFSFVEKHPHFYFYLFITLLFDPGGYLRTFLSKGILGGFYYTDLFFVLSFLPLFSSKIKIKGIFKDKYFKAIFILLSLFLIYHLTVHALFVPDHDIRYWLRYVVIRDRYTYFGFLIIVPTYIIARENVKIFINFIVIVPTVVLILYLVTILTPINLVEIRFTERYTGSGIWRIGLSGSITWGTFLIPLAASVHYMKINFRYKKLVYIGLMLYLISVVISLTKTQFIGILAYVALTVYLIYKFTNLQLLLGYLKILLPSTVFILLLFLLFPRYVDYGMLAIDDIRRLMTGNTTYNYGRQEAREQNLIQHLAIIERYPYFGTGAKRINEKKVFINLDDDVTDLSLTGQTAQYGLIGISFYFMTYLLIIYLIRKHLSNMKRIFNPRKEEYILPMIVTIIVVVYFLNIFIFRIPNYFIELTVDLTRIMISFMTGLLLACLNYSNGKILVEKNNLSIQEVNKS